LTVFYLQDISDTVTILAWPC